MWAMWFAETLLMAALLRIVWSRHRLLSVWLIGNLCITATRWIAWSDHQYLIYWTGFYLLCPVAIAVVAVSAYKRHYWIVAALVLYYTCFLLTRSVPNYGNVVIVTKWIPRFVCLLFLLLADRRPGPFSICRGEVMKKTVIRILHTTFILVVIGVFLAGRPPAKAQNQQAIDAVQDQRISQNERNLERHESIDDARVAALGQKFEEMSSRVSVMQGWVQGGAGLLVALQLVSMWLVNKRDRKG